MSPPTPPYLAMYIWLTGASPSSAGQPSAPLGGKESNTTPVAPPARPTSFGSSGPVTTWRIKVLFSWMKVSMTQRLVQGVASGVRKAAHEERLAWNGAAPVAGHWAQAPSSNAAVPIAICEYQVWSMMVHDVALYLKHEPSSFRCVVSSRWRRAAIITCPSRSNNEGFMSRPPAASVSVSGKRTSTMWLSCRTNAGRSGLASGVGRNILRPPNANDKQMGMPQRALGCLLHHLCTGRCTVCTTKTAVMVRKMRNKGKEMRPFFGQTL
mmetsp:Transcript_62323/g.193365  ORF Transcript_62323/g.193365 Transcript_62323/m.193365 type:complete len:267 (+) Transcript_62323:810-1610(+)